jgi:hypothetical protein
MFAKIIAAGLETQEISIVRGCSSGHYPSQGGCYHGIVPVNGVCRAGALL